MFDVIIALLPPMIAGIYFFGYRVMVLLTIAILASVLSEWIWCKLQRVPNTVWDLSAVVSAIILVMNLPVTAPLWIPIVGSIFMIIIVKMCFGGLGQNFVNPAAAARIFLVVSFPAAMTKWVVPFTKLDIFASQAITSATPLAIAKYGGGELPSIMSMYLGFTGGCIGETSVVAILIGFIYLLWRKVIKWDTTIAYLATVAAFMLVVGNNPVFHLFAGGLMFGAVFMATDYTTSPITARGRVIFGVGLGLLTGIIRVFGGYPEGVCLSILVMNVLTPLIDKIKPRRFGTGRVSS
jgi:electron transport complex protein RnfD